MSIINQPVQTRQTLLESLLTSAKLLDVAQMGGRDLVTNAPRIDAALDELAAALEAAGVAEPLPAGTAKVTDGTATSVSSGSKSVPANLSVSGNSLSGITLSTETDAVASDTDAISIQDRNGTTLLGSGVAARVARGGLVSAYFTGLTNALNSDGNPLDVTTARAGSTVAGRVRVYVANNVVKNVYLDATAALQSGATVPVQNSKGLNIGAGTVTVTNNLVASAKLPANITAFRDGLAHDVSDKAGRKASAVCEVSDGTLTGQTLADTAALVTDGLSLTIGGKVYAFTVANGDVSAIAVTDAPA